MIVHLRVKFWANVSMYVNCLKCRNYGPAALAFRTCKVLFVVLSLHYESDYWISQLYA